MLCMPLRCACSSTSPACLLALPAHPPTHERTGQPACGSTFVPGLWSVCITTITWFLCSEFIPYMGSVAQSFGWCWCWCWCWYVFHYAYLQDSCIFCSCRTPSSLAKSRITLYFCISTVDFLLLRCYIKLTLIITQ